MSFIKNMQPGALASNKKHFQTIHTSNHLISEIPHHFCLAGT
jgi:hypothetical protein